METRAANSFKLSLEGGALILEFGNVARSGSSLGAAGVAVTDRVILPVETGRRLALGLDDCLQQHAAALRADEAKALPPAEAAAATRPGRTPARPPSEEAGERATQLLRMVGNLGAPYLYERSFRMCHRALLANRFLLTLDTRDIPGDPSGRVLEICDRLSMPASARQAAESNFGMAKCVHFGFEADRGGTICKLYLERAVPEEEAARARAGREPVLLHLAFKWDVGRGDAVTTRYWWRPGLTTPDIKERLAQVYSGGQQGSFDIACAALSLTEGRISTETLQYLEVEEAENARRSFDLNLYDAKLQMKDIQSLLNRMREYFGVRPGQFQALYDQIKTKTLGHLAGGVHRNEEEFFNIYYGVVGLPHFHGQFQ
jgi:hypothetical protein